MHHTLLRVRKLHRVEGSGSNAGTRHLSPQQAFRYRVSIVYFKTPDLILTRPLCRGQLGTPGTFALVKRLHDAFRGVGLP
jgi:hypothetical protein